MDLAIVSTDVPGFIGHAIRIEIQAKVDDDNLHIVCKLNVSTRHLLIKDDNSATVPIYSKVF